MKLSELVGLVAARFGRGEAVCESCGGEFKCGARVSGCGCAAVQLDDATRAELRARFQRCLCRACLENYAARGAEGRERDDL